MLCKTNRSNHNYLVDRLESMDRFSATAPGRLCLFGEHQDYLGLPVIALAIPLRCRINVTPSLGNRILELRVPALDQECCYDLDKLPPRQQQSNSATSSEKPDFALAAIYECLDEGWEFQHGALCISSTEIVMQAGCSSSTAFCVAWVLVLAKLAGKEQELENDRIKLAQLAHRAEVLHFGAPGGTMDHCTISIGGSCLRIGPGMWEVTKLRNLALNDGVWVLADSGEPKDTIGHLTRCKGDRLRLLEKLGGRWDAKVDDKNLDENEQILLQATLTTRDMESLAAKSWVEPVVSTDEDDEESLGQKLALMMLRHHEALRDGLLLSTPKLEAMRKAAIESGAWGFKLVGSGGGGHGVAWTSRETAADVAAAMTAVGARATWTISEPCEGAKLII